jgi:hypothetical protein
MKKSLPNGWTGSAFQNFNKSRFPYVILLT